MQSVKHQNWSRIRYFLACKDSDGNKISNYDTDEADPYLAESDIKIIDYTGFLLKPDYYVIEY